LLSGVDGTGGSGPEDPAQCSQQEQQAAAEQRQRECDSHTDLSLDESSLVKSVVQYKCE
jgi:hypothetical protein